MKVGLKKRDELVFQEIQEENKRPETSANQEKLEMLVQQMISLLGENPKRSGLIDTPKRFSKALRFLTSGYELSQSLQQAFFQRMPN